MGKAWKESQVMPVYEYMCSHCSISYPISRGIEEAEPEYSCDQCGDKLYRKFHVGGVQFNGGGFYSTDKG
jgi:putative FmdB family regulatory protein